MSISLTTINSPAEVSLSKNQVPFHFLVVADADEINIKVHLFLEMYLNGSTTPTQDVTLNATPDDDGMVYFDIQQLLLHADNYAFTYPDVTLGGTAHPSLMARFDVAAYTTHSTNTAGTIAYMRKDFYYINGGISTDDNAYLVDDGSTWWSYFSTQQLFLDFLPGSKSTCLGAPERLYWIALRTETEKLRIEWHATDGTTGVFYENIAMTLNTVYELTVSPQLVQDKAGKTITKYNVQIDGFLGEQDYHIFKANYRGKKFFLFQNQYGVWETLWCRGILTDTNTYEKTAVQLSKKNLNLIRNPLAHQNTYTQDNLLRQGETNTGFLFGNAWALWASDILSGAPCYIAENDRLYPITVDTTESTVREEPNLNRLYLNVQYSYSKKSLFPNRLWNKNKTYEILTEENGTVMTTEDDRIIILK